MCEGCRRRRERMGWVWVIKGMVKRFAVASRRKALRIVEPVWEGSGVIFGLEAGDWKVDMVGCSVFLDIGLFEVDLGGCCRNICI